MLTATIRFYITNAGIAATLGTLLKVTWSIRGYMAQAASATEKVAQALSSHLDNDNIRFSNIERKFSEQDSDIREIRQGRKIR